MNIDVYLKDETNLTIIYEINPSENLVKIFGNNFVKKNKHIYKIIYEDKDYELTEYFDLKKICINKDKLQIKLNGNLNIIDMSECLKIVIYYYLCQMMKNGILKMQLICLICFIIVYHYHHFLQFLNLIPLKSLI